MWSIWNWIKGKLCTNKGGHVPHRRYNGMTVVGFECEICGYQCLDNKCMMKPVPNYTGVYVGVGVIVVIILLFVWMKPKSFKKMFKKKR